MSHSALGVSLSGQRWVCYGALGSLPLTGWPRSRTPPLPLLPPRSAAASPLLPFAGQGSVGEGWQPSWEQPEYAKPRGTLSPLPGFASDAVPRSWAPLARGVEPPGCIFLGFAPAGMLNGTVVVGRAPCAREGAAGCPPLAASRLLSSSATSCLLFSHPFIFPLFPPTFLTPLWQLGG